jgi:hypothetical protein
MLRSLFRSSEAEVPVGRYQVEIISGDMMQRSHLPKVQQRLNEGEQRGWGLVSASTSNEAMGSGWITSIYWDTTPEDS